jgi:hypothetical protein
VHSSPGLREQRLPGHSFEHKKEEQSQEPKQEREEKKERKERWKTKKVKKKKKKMSPSNGCSWTFTVISFNDQRGAPLLAPFLVFTPRRFA